MIERPTKEWLERVTRIFGKRKPHGITLRGDGTFFHFNTYEIRLVSIHNRTKKYYKRNPKNSFYLNEKHLADQEKTIWLLSYQFDLNLEEVLGGDYDFIPRPLEGASSYELGLADTIFITESLEVIPLLNFQYYNNVIVENSDKVKFIQILHHYVKHYLKSRFSTVPEEKLTILNGWILEKIEKFDEAERKRFYWYELEYKEANPKFEEGNSHSKENDHASSSKDLNDEVSMPDKSKVKFPELTGNPKIKCNCSVLQIDDYFQKLATIPSGSNKPLVNKDAVDWMIAKYFSENSDHLRKPNVRCTLDKVELTLFMHFFAFEYGRNDSSQRNTQFNQLIVLLNEAFPKIVPKRSMAMCYKKASTWKHKPRSPQLTHLDVYTDK